MRLILDTNVIVSALIQRSYPYFIVDRVLVDTSLQICLSEKLFNEYLDVLNRDKFNRFPDFQIRAQLLLADIESRSLLFKPTMTVDLISDEADNRLLELAESCQADYIVTGNTRDFTMSNYKGTKIIAPKEFFDMLNK
ncbi:putative toxin-antitoxin system toxin component, PIN family [Spirosoma terrae]|uniref:Putative toxin-antitoxin system toxin component, PIN family n=1 Tax=Spirosoma terrae TaxID=1968276 RepID=A0A6L9LED3_9BACT|nr:putative toxin-antitoxin system toxin component, PIN family [Spirosoma terrae]NDU98935.1 putative toxin-antitoxin system toxin component, PIN family [Spirosoma terrae]